jgi:hypothetical protein
MGTFSETAIVDYCLSFADHQKQTYVCHFRLQQTKEVCRFRFPFAENKRKLPFSIFRIPETCGHGDTGTWGHGDIKQKTEDPAIFLNPFTICMSKWKFVVFVCVLMKKQTYSFANGQNGLAQLCVY